MDVRMKMVHFHQEGGGYKKSSTTVRNIIRKWKINGTVKAMSGRLRKCSDRMARDLMRNDQKNRHITAKELQKRVAGTGLAVHRTTIQHTLNNKDLHGRVTRKKPSLRPQHKIKPV